MSVAKNVGCTCANIVSIIAGDSLWLQQNLYLTVRRPYNVESFNVPYLETTLKHQQAGVSGPGQFPCPQCGKTYKYVNNSTFSYFFHNVCDTNWFWLNYVYLIWSKSVCAITTVSRHCNMHIVFLTPYFYLHARHVDILVFMHWNNEII